MSESPRKRARRGQPILAEDIARLQDAAWQGRAMQQLSSHALLIPTFAFVVADSAVGTVHAVHAVFATAGQIVDADPENFLHVQELETGELLNVLKPYTLRPSVTSRAGVTFEYSTPQARTATQGEVVESQVIVPSYEVGDLIVIERTLHPLGGSSPPLWRDVNDDGRQWAVTTE